MKCIYLSPSVQQFNLYNGPGNEEEYMNLVADSVARYLDSYGICYDRNDPQMSVSDIVDSSNAKEYALHLAIHSNAAGEGNYGEVKGSEVYYYPSSQKGSMLANIIADNMKSIYPDVDKVSVKTSSSFAELKRTKAPSVLVEVAYHDNEEDADWIRNNVDAIGEQLALSVKEFLDELHTDANNSNNGTVITMGGNLNVRAEPNVNSSILFKLPNGTRIRIIECEGRWCKIEHNGAQGFVFRHYICKD